MESIQCYLTGIYMMPFKWKGKNKNNLNSILMVSYIFPSNLHISPILNGVSIQMKGKRNTEGRRFKWFLLNTYIGTFYHKSMERNIKGKLKKYFISMEMELILNAFPFVKGLEGDLITTRPLVEHLSQVSKQKSTPWSRRRCHNKIVTAFSKGQLAILKMAAIRPYFFIDWNDLLADTSRHWQEFICKVSNKFIQWKISGKFRKNPTRGLGGDEITRKSLWTDGWTDRRRMTQHVIRIQPVV